MTNNYGYIDPMFAQIMQQQQQLTPQQMQILMALQAQQQQQQQGGQQQQGQQGPPKQEGMDLGKWVKAIKNVKKGYDTVSDWWGGGDELANIGSDAAYDAAATNFLNTGEVNFVSGLGEGATDAALQNFLGGGEVTFDAGMALGEPSYTLGADLGMEGLEGLGSEIGKDIGTEVGAEVGKDVGTELGKDVGTNWGSMAGTALAGAGALYGGYNAYQGIKEGNPMMAGMGGLGAGMGVASLAGVGAGMGAMGAMAALGPYGLAAAAIMAGIAALNHKERTNVEDKKLEALEKYFDENGIDKSVLPGYNPETGKLDIVDEERGADQQLKDNMEKYGIDDPDFVGWKDGVFINNKWLNSGGDESTLTGIDISGYADVTQQLLEDGTIQPGMDEMAVKKATMDYADKALAAGAVEEKLGSVFIDKDKVAAFNKEGWEPSSFNEFIEQTTKQHQAALEGGSAGIVPTRGSKAPGENKPDSGVAKPTAESIASGATPMPQPGRTPGWTQYPGGGQFNPNETINTRPPMQMGPNIDPGFRVTPEQLQQMQKPNPQLTEALQKGTSPQTQSLIQQLGAGQVRPAIWMNPQMQQMAQQQQQGGQQPSWQSIAQQGQQSLSPQTQQVLQQMFAGNQAGNRLPQQMQSQPGMWGGRPVTPY